MKALMEWGGFSKSSARSIKVHSLAPPRSLSKYDSSRSPLVRRRHLYLKVSAPSEFTDCMPANSIDMR